LRALQMEAEAAGISSGSGLHGAPGASMDEDDIEANGHPDRPPGDGLDYSDDTGISGAGAPFEWMNGAGWQPVPSPLATTDRLGNRGIEGIRAG